jgi:nitrate reductase beta subunit
MSDDSRIKQAAEYVAKQYEAHQSIDIMGQDFAPRSIEEAYAVQAAFLQLLAATKGPVGGYKIASTNPATRQLGFLPVIFIVRPPLSTVRTTSSSVLNARSACGWPPTYPHPARRIPVAMCPTPSNR